MIRCFLGVLCFSIAMLNSAAQNFELEFTKILDVPVYENEEELKNPWVGGLNYLQYSTIELNNDGFEDLFIFDRSCNKILTYVNDGIVGVVSYSYAPEYETIFPQGLRNWVLLRDYDCDGLKDIFASKSGGILLFKQVVIDGVISFEQIYDNLIPAEYNYGSPAISPVFNISVDLPHIGDIDNDGDIDILTFSEASTTVYYYINEASDFDRCDTLSLRLGNRCYGFISESSEDNSIFLEYDGCAENNVIDPRSDEERPEVANRSGLHTGGTLLSIETNGDGKPELILGDITNDSLIMLTNAQSIQGPDSMVAQASNFPASFSDSELINFFEFPGAYHEDFNNDGIKDLASSSFSSFNSIDDFGSWLYLNTEDDDFPNFELQKKDWLQDDMLEHGTEALPVVFDYNQDGLGDLIIGNRKTVINASTQVSTLRLYENVGSITNPEFELRDEDWLELSGLGILHIYPAFGDMDGDGDYDMYIGEATGKIHYFENSAGIGNPVQFPEGIPSILSIEDIEGDDVDPGQDVIPQIIDLNEDGLLDLAIGEQWGNMNFYKNVGTVNAPEFEFVNDSLGFFFVDSFFGVQGKCAPFFFKDSEDEWNLLTGNELGNIQRWNNISGNLEGTWNEADSSLLAINDGSFATPFLFDINGDSHLDMFLGNERGGVTLYYGDFVDSTSEIDANKFSARIFPNPSNGLFQINFKNELPERYLIYSLDGKLLREETVNARLIDLNCSEFSPGFYSVVAVSKGQKFKLGKLVIQ